LVSSRVIEVINSGYLGADATVGRDGHMIVIRSRSSAVRVSQTESETLGAMSPAASWTRVFLALGDHFLAK
jgi:hypothetical protein